MAELDAFLSALWAFLLAALIVTGIAYPFAFVGNWLYEWLTDAYDETPKFALLLAATFIMTVVFLFLLEQYLGFSLAKAAVAFNPTPSP